MENDALIIDGHENQRLSIENKALRNAIRPFLAVMDAYDAGLLKNARPQWSDVEGDQNRVVLLQDRTGEKLLVLEDFVEAKSAFLVCRPEFASGKRD